jgi:ArsR family transcriptional regulator
MANPTLDLDLERAATLFHALSDATRLSILERLRSGERCVCELTDDLEAAQSRLSFHLKVLKDAGLVSDRREGRWMYYTVKPDALAEVHDVSVALQPSTAKLGRSSSRASRCCD